METGKSFRLGKGPIRDIVAKAAEMYNRYRGAEAKAEVIKVTGDRIYVKIYGSFCLTCGVNDWVEDFRYVLEDLGVEAELEKIIEPPDPEAPWRIGVFRVKSVKG